MKTSVLLSVVAPVALAAGFALGMSFESLPVQEATRRIPQFENDQVRVWKTIIMPEQPLEMHRHDHGRVIVALEGGTLTIVPEEGEPEQMTWETGNAYWLPPDPPDEQHGDVNEGEEPIEVMVIELRH